MMSRPAITTLLEGPGGLIVRRDETFELVEPVEDDDELVSTSHVGVSHDDDEAAVRTHIVSKK